MTHTLETTGIARVVARALRLNEDLTEAIGLGHDMGHPPFGHAGEAALDAALRDHGQRRLPAQRAVGADRRAPEPHPRGASTGSSRTRGRASPRRSRARSSGSSTASPTSTTTSTTRSATGSSPRATCRATRSPCSARRGTEPHRHARPRPGRAVGARRATSCRATRSAARCSRCARSCSSASTSARTRSPSTSGPRATVRRIFEHLARPRRRARGDHRVHRRA